MKHLATDNGQPVCRAVPEEEYGVLRLHLVRNIEASDCPACAEIVNIAAVEQEAPVPVIHQAGDDDRPLCGADPENGVWHLAANAGQVNCVACILAMGSSEVHSDGAPSETTDAMVGEGNPPGPGQAGDGAPETPPAPNGETPRRRRSRRQTNDDPPGA